MSPHSELLKKVALFANVPEPDLERIGTFLVERSCPKDTTIVSRDEPGDSMFIIVKGRVKVVIHGDNGREVILTMLKTGEFFGEMALVDD